MNQILSVEKKKKKEKKQKQPREPRNPYQKADLHTVKLVFAISLIIFGVGLISTGTYAFYKSINEPPTVAVQKPEININQNEDNTLTINATHPNGIRDLVYSWDDGEAIRIEGNNQTTVTQTIELPGGTNTLKVIATEISGESILFEKAYTSNQGIQIDLKAEDTNIKATITAENEISFITYKWDDGEEVRQDINSTTGEAIIEIPEGLHTLTVIAVDINNETATKTQEVRGVKKPKLEVTQDGDNFNVNVSDENGLDKIEFILNGQGYLVRLEGATQRQISYPLEDGENTLEVTVYNSAGVTETIAVKCTK